jgi:hypothetical protein
MLAPERHCLSAFLNVPKPVMGDAAKALVRPGPIKRLSAVVAGWQWLEHLISCPVYHTILPHFAHNVNPKVIYYSP